MGRTTVSKSLKDEVRRRARGRCENCNRKFPPAFMDADHITPVRVGGANTLANLQLLCRECNGKKGGTALKCSCGEENLHNARYCQGCKKRITPGERRQFGWIPREGFDLRQIAIKTIGTLLILYCLYLYLKR